MLAFIACDKSDVDVEDNTIETFDRPSFYDWEIAYLKSDDTYYRRLFYCADSVVYERWLKTETDIYKFNDKFSTHNNVFADVDPSKMTDSQLVEFANDFAKELKREPDRIAWIETLDLITIYDSPTAYGLLWGLRPSGMSATTPAFFVKDYDLTLQYKVDDDLSYMLYFVIDTVKDTETLYVSKFVKDDRRHTEKVALAEIQI